MREVAPVLQVIPAGLAQPLLAAFRPTKRQHVHDAVDALFSGPSGGEKLTWTRVCSKLPASAAAKQIELGQLPAALDAFRDGAREPRLAVFFPQTFRMVFLEGLDEEAASQTAGDKASQATAQQQ